MTNMVSEFKNPSLANPTYFVNLVANSFGYILDISELVKSK